MHMLESGAALLYWEGSRGEHKHNRVTEQTRADEGHSNRAQFD